MDHCPLSQTQPHDNHGDFTANQSVKRCLRFDPAPSTLTPAIFACYARLGVEMSELTHCHNPNTEIYECLKLIFNCKSCENDWLDFFPHNGEDCMQPKFTRSLKEEGV